MSGRMRHSAAMSKAFTKESDAEDTDSAEPEAPSPAGVKNYMTPKGLRRLREEFEQLTRVERPKVVEVVRWAAGNGDRSENGDYIYGKKRLREIDRRLHFLIKRIESAVVVDPARQTNREQVFFGATVTYAEEDSGEEKTLRIVGVDEANSERGEVSWISPIARALMKAEEGEVVSLASPNGLRRLRVVKIAYAPEEAE